MRIAECVLHETLYESNSTRVYRAKHEPSNRDVIVKQARVSRTSSTSRLRREYRLAAGIGDEAVVEPLAFEDDGALPAIIYADFGGVALSGILGEPRPRSVLSMACFLDLACRLAGILRVVHANQIVHQDVKPANIIWNEQSGEVRLTDFGIAVRSDGGLVSSLRMRGTLAYMAPEQSGRMNRPVDHRADLYSLGVTLYEAATGRLPFETSDDVLEMIHRHLAVRPVDPHLVTPTIPETLSAVLMKLLAKDAEDRYQSATGLYQDLEECRRQWTQDGEIAPFVPGQRDVSEVFSVSAKLYGRETEKNDLVQILKRVISGGREICLIRGFAGIGKSSMAYGLQDAVIESRGYFVAGKFDQYQVGIPYSGILKAFRQLINEILKEPPDELEEQKARLQNVLGANGRIITEVIPEMERVIGPQPEPIPVGPEEAENRFISVFQDFVRVLARPDRPLVLFIDDLHWADTASLRLLQVLLTATGIRYLMILGAYRDNEVEAEHPLATMIDRLAQREVVVHFLQVEALDRAEVNRLIAATLHTPPEHTESLASFVHQKTGGNPFFVREFLRNLHRSGHIHFDPARGVWAWDAGRISSLPAPDQIGELMAEKIQHLESEARSALQIAACIGDRFERRFLAALLKRPEGEVAAMLQPALREGLVSPMLSGLDDRVKDVDSTLEITPAESHYQFQHDRVQQAAYDSLPVDLRRRHHRRIAAEWIRRSETSVDADDRVFAVVHHLDACGDIVFEEPEAERRGLAGYYLRGGRRALDSVAYQAAADSLAAGIRLLPESAWQNDGDLIRSLSVANAEAEHLCSRNERCIELLETVLKYTPSPLDRVPAYEIYLRALNALGEMDRLLDVALQALESLGVHLPPNPGEGRALVSILKTQALIRWKGAESISTAPELRDRNLLSAMRILALFASGSFKTRPNLYAVAMCRYAQITYRGGRSPAAAYGLMSMAVILASVGSFRQANQLSRIALKLLTKDNDHSAKTLFAQVVFVAHWTEALEKGFDRFREAHRVGVANGDIEYGGYASLFLSVYRMYSTGTLVAVEPEVAGLYELVRNFRNANVLWATRFFYQLILILRDPSMDGGELSGRVFERDPDVERLRELNLQSEIHLYHGAEALLLYLLGEYERAFVAIQESQRRKKYVRAMYFVPHGDYLEALIRLALLANMNPAEARECRRRLKGPMRRMRKLKDVNPDVFLHKWHLLKGEVARVDGRHEAAALSYNLAIETANRRGYILDEALVCERAGEYYASIGNDRIARNYIEDAHRVYGRWGAQAKVRQLEERYPKIFLSDGGEARAPNRETLESTIAFATRSESGDLDIETVTKAVQMLFAGQDAAAVMDEFLRLSVENAGAQRGALILRRGDRLWLEAARDLNATGGEFRAQPFESYTALPREVIHYVLHTGRPVVLADACESGEFTADPYIRRSRCKSILATPIVYDGNVRGVLYLENRLAAGVFTRLRLQILSVLSHQAAVSLENARLYEHMQSEIGEKTRQLLKLKLARDRMDPHFLFNSLNMVQALMRKNPETANRALTVLAELYEMLTGISSAELVDFEQEWRFLEEYLKLMQMRYASSLEVTIDRPDELPRFRIPPLSLQPIVENSFKHGFKQLTGTMQIHVVLSVLHDRVQIEFRDNGSDFEREIQPGDTLFSILERLRHYFPKAMLNRTGPGVVTVMIYGTRDSGSINRNL